MRRRISKPFRSFLRIILSSFYKPFTASHVIAEGLWGAVFGVQDAGCVAKIQLDLSKVPPKPDVPLYERWGDFSSVEKTACKRLRGEKNIAEYLCETTVRMRRIETWPLAQVLQARHAERSHQREQPNHTGHVQAKTIRVSIYQTVNSANCC